MPFRSSCCVIIVGAGLGGLAVAIGIRKAGYSVLVLEKVEELREVGAGIEIASNAALALQQLGILEKALRYSISPQDIVLRSYHTGAVLSKQNLIPHCMETYGYPHFDIHRADLHRVLYEEASSLGVDIRLNASVANIDIPKTTVRLDSGEIFAGSVIIGADGQKSKCREILLGRPDPLLQSGDLGFRIVLRAADMRERPELRSLLEPPNINAWFGPHSHVVSYLLQKDDLFNVFLGGPEDKADLGTIGPQRATIEELEARFAGWDPRLKSLLELAQETRKWTMFRGSDILTWSSPQKNFTLLGDAAHGMLPYLGQGAAQSFEDAVALSTLLSKCTHPSELRKAVVLYEQLRFPRAMEVRRRSHEVRATHGYPDGPLQEERDRLLNLPPFKEYPNVWADPVFQPWLWGYDAASEAGKLWDSCQSEDTRVADFALRVLRRLLSSAYSLLIQALRRL